MPSCAIITCRARSQVTSVAQGGISFHRFPKDRKTRAQWIKVTGRDEWIPTRTSTICSRHFNEEDFMTKSSGNRFLRMGAVPCQKIVKIHSNKTVTNGDNKLTVPEVKTARLDDPLTTANDFDSDEPLSSEQNVTLCTDPLSENSNSDITPDERFEEKISTRLRKKLKEKEETCAEHLNKIESLVRANRRFCQQNKSLKRILMRMKKKIKTLEGSCEIISGADDSS